MTRVLLVRVAADLAALAGDDGDSVLCEGEVDAARGPAVAGEGGEQLALLAEDGQVEGVVVGGHHELVPLVEAQAEGELGQAHAALYLAQQPAAVGEDLDVDVVVRPVVA